MRKSIVVLAAALVAGSMANVSIADARGLRIGLGFGVPFGAGPRHADPTILERLDRQRYKTVRTHEAAGYERRQAAIAAAKARAQQQAADRQAAARHVAAKEAAVREAQRQTRESASARKQALVARPEVIAPVAPVAAAVIPAEERALEVAQEQQREKAEQLLKSLSATSQQAAPAIQSRPKLVVAPALDRVAAPAPVVTPIAAPNAAVPVAAPSKAAVSGDCKRFIPGAGVTISVPCSE